MKGGGGVSSAPKPLLEEKMPPRAPLAAGLHASYPVQVRKFFPKPSLDFILTFPTYLTGSK